MAYGDINTEYTDNSVPTLDTYMVGLMLGKAQSTIRTWIKRGGLEAKRHTDGTLRVSALSVAYALEERYGSYAAPTTLAFQWANESVKTARELAEQLGHWSGELAPRMLVDAEGRAQRLYSPSFAERAHHAKVLDGFKAK